MEKLMTSCCPASRNLLRYLDKWKKSPQLDIDLGYELECFLVQFEQRKYDPENLNANDFAEVAIFVQNYATIYDKKVDLLLKSLLVLHKELCDISSKPVENEENQENKEPGQETPENNIPPEQQAVEEPKTIEDLKNKKKKKGKEVPKENETNPENQPSTSTTLTEAEINALTEEMKAKDAFTEKEMKEIGELWKMLNKIEKHKIENILNNLDENEGIEELWEKLESKKQEIKDSLKSQNTTNTTLNDSGFYSHADTLNTTFHESQIIDEPTDGDIEKLLNSTLNTSDFDKLLENDENTPSQDSETNQNEVTPISESQENGESQEINPNIEQNQEKLNENVDQNSSPDNPEIVGTLSETLENQLDTVENLPENDRSNCSSPDLFGDDTIETNSVDQNFIEAKIEALKEVRVRLKRLTHDEILENSESYRKKFKSSKIDAESACLNCTGCKAIKNICSLDGVKSEVKKKEEDMKIPERKLRKRGLEDENQVSTKRIRLNKKRVIANANDFENFYDECYKNLEWNGDNLTVDKNILTSLKNIKLKSDINANDISEDEDVTKDNQDSDDDFDINDSTDINDGAEIKMGSNANVETDKNNINEKDDHTINEINIESDIEVSKTCHEVMSELIDEVSRLDKTSEDVNIRFSQESGYAEDFFTDNDFDSLNQSQFEKELENLSCQNKDILGLEKNDPSITALNDNDGAFLSPCYFPHTPAHSEDSGRFSSAACHSDIEGENLNRSIHVDSGVEMSHHSDDEDDNNSDIMPFKGLDPKTLSFYKKKCESLLEQRERDQKVRDWQKFLKEKEAKKTQLPEFHIDEYETKILDALPEDSTNSVTFNSVVEGKSAEEVARFFAATLQLANMNNVAISDTDIPADGANKSFKLTLKSKEKYYENIELSDSFMENLSRKPFATSTPFKAPKPKFKKFKY